MAKELFRRESLEAAAAPERLDDYIRTANPGMWLALAAVFVFLGCALLWSLTAVIPDTVSLYVTPKAGDESGRRFTAYISPRNAAKLRPGMEARVGDAPARITGLDAAPLSRREAAAGLESDYAVEALGIGDWNIRVTLETAVPVERAALIPAGITAARVRPLDFVFGSGGGD